MNNLKLISTSAWEVVVYCYNMFQTAAAEIVKRETKTYKTTSDVSKKILMEHPYNGTTLGAFLRETKVYPWYDLTFGDHSKSITQVETIFVILKQLISY